MKPTLAAAFLFLCVLCSACGSSATSPSPTPTPTPQPTPPPPVIQQIIDVGVCPTAGPADLNFFREMACNAFDQPLQPVRRWMVAPKVYLKTVDEAGATIDPGTLDTVQNAMIEIAPRLTAGRFGLEGVLRGTDSRENVSGWITVKWPATPNGVTCGRAQVAVDGGWIELYYKTPNCSCNESAIRAGTAHHELGHALGYWHTDSPNDLMYVNSPSCDQALSGRELQAIAYHYR